MPDRDPSHLFPLFESRIERILHNLNEYCKVHQPHWTAVFGEGFRSVARQQELYAKRPRVTQKNGTTNRSKHQSSMAVDVWFFTGGDPKAIDFESVPHDVYQYLGHLARLEHLTWGGDWKGNLGDYGHVEWPVTDLESYRKAHEWQKAKGLA